MPDKEYYKIISFYRFTEINNKKLLKNKIEIFLENYCVKGTILLSNEGINGSLSVPSSNLGEILLFLKKILNIKKLSLKINDTSFIPFNRLKVRLKKEIVSLGQGKIDVSKLGGKIVNPEEWDELISKKTTKLIDVRNIYEIEIGRFKKSINPNTDNFRQFPNSIKKLGIKKEDHIAMYCTGGIRCEKASAFLKSKGFTKVYQLEGGIINYLSYKKENKKKSKWIGECFVFDERVTINKNLTKGKYSQCYGCRRPISKKDMLSTHYKKGIQCPHCYKHRSENQIKKSTSRQKQIEIAIKKNIRNTFLKIKS